MSKGQNESKGFQVPSPLEIAILLTLVVFLLSSVFTSHGPSENLTFWGEGLWSLLTFMTQMCLILLGGYVVAVSKPVQKVLGQIVKIPRTESQCYHMTFFVSALSCWMNWGLGLVVSAFFALEMARQHKNLNYPFLVAISYMGFIFWHGGLSGSIPLVVSTPDNFSYEWVGRLVDVSETIFSTANLMLVAILFIVMNVGLRFFTRWDKEKTSFSFEVHTSDTLESHEKLSGLSGIYYWILLIFCGAFLIHTLFSGHFKLGLNQVNFILIFLGLTFHGSLQAYLGAVQQGSQKLAPILVQYPLYAGIMGMMVKSGLAVQISDAFVAFSTESTYSFYMFLSAGVVNFFVPSGGGQWAVQAPVVLEGAKELGVPMGKAIMAVAWGDAWTNLAQPFWALPLLSIAGLGIKDIMGYCLLALVLSGSVIGVFFLLI